MHAWAQGLMSRTKTSQQDSWYLSAGRASTTTCNPRGCSCSCGRRRSCISCQPQHSHDGGSNLVNASYINCAHPVRERRSGAELPAWPHALPSCLPAVRGQLRAAACWKGPCIDAAAAALSLTCTHDSNMCDDLRTTRNMQGLREFRVGRGRGLFNA